MLIRKSLGVAIVSGCSYFFLAPAVNNTPEPRTAKEITVCYTNKGCVFKTVFGEEASDSAFVFNTPANVMNSIDRGLAWMATAQQANGGWGAGSHHRQNIIDPHAVNTDPATTAMVGMALLRTGNTLASGQYSRQLQGALNYLLESVESTPADRLKITEESGTQIQTKLGDNIDAVLAMQFFSNVLDEVKNDLPLKQRVLDALETCARKIEQLQDSDGSIKGAGWAGVLQSALANSALEAAQYRGVEISEVVMERSRNYQKGNYDATTGDVKTDRGAGIVLYSVSGSVRASAKEARRVREEIEKAKREGKLKDTDEVSAEILMELDIEEAEAVQLAASYQVYESSKNVAQDDNVMVGFGNNGGEEFLSFLQTGESLIINRDAEWKDWYANTSGRLISIQNEDGSWNGHHCITSPVFCTATTLLTLSINNDVDKLVALGGK